MLPLCSIIHNRNHKSGIFPRLVHGPSVNSGAPVRRVHKAGPYNTRARNALAIEHRWTVLQHKEGGVIPHPSFLGQLFVLITLTEDRDVSPKTVPSTPERKRESPSFTWGDHGARWVSLGAPSLP
ncbi:hypothetical protein BS17DRAFT_242556 [Gyrodon lividus]|nr:hypothetical protein BS17DRAFT_242556 [Gyrodon lividus]